MSATAFLFGLLFTVALLTYYALFVAGKPKPALESDEPPTPEQIEQFEQGKAFIADGIDHQINLGFQCETLAAILKALGQMKQTKEVEILSELISNRMDNILTEMDDTQTAVSQQFENLLA
jgi:hypothetical protein